MYTRNRLYITPTGFQNLKLKLTRLQKEQQQLGKELYATREPGKPEENTSYAMVRSRLHHVEMNMQTINQTLREAILIKKPARKTMVKRGSTVKLKSSDEIRQFTVVGSLEADPSNGRISDQSQAGAQLLGKRAGDRIEIGNGIKKIYTILDIS